MSGNARVVIERVVMSEFRSWQAGAFEFSPGVTLVTGKNGSGKSTIGMGVQYATTGKLPKLAKDDIRRIGAASGAKVRVSLHLVVDGQAVVLTRTNGKATLKVDEGTMSVREADYLDDLKQSIEYSFLSQTAAAFVDMPEFKRRELLDGLIPEVQLLRSVCQPELKKVLKRYNDKRQSVSANISQVQHTLQDHKGFLFTAKLNYDNAVARHQSIIDAQVAKLPFTQEQYEWWIAERDRVAALITSTETYLNEARKWLDYAQTEINTQKSVRANLERRKENMRNIAEYHAHLERLRDSDSGVICTECHQPLECRQCGHAMTNPNDTADNRQQIARLADQLAAVQKEIAADEHYLEVSAPIDHEQFTTTSGAYNMALNDLNVLRPQLAAAQSNIASYQQVESNIMAAREAADDTESLAAFKRQYMEMEERRQSLEALVQRKERLHGIMLELENDLRAASEIMYNTLPLIYFDEFLQNLARACNFLLNAISNMSVAMYTTEDGIAVTVAGKKLAQLSSGEMQRVRVAVTLAFSLMAVKTDTLFLDEVFDSALDQDGVTALATLLHGTVSRFYSKIVVITHNEALMVALQPTQVVVVSKDGNGLSKTEIHDGQKLGLISV